MSSVPCSSSIRFLYWSFSFIDVDTLLPLGVDRLLRFVQRSDQPCPLSRFKSTSVLRTKIGDSALALNRQITHHGTLATWLCSRHVGHMGPDGAASPRSRLNGNLPKIQIDLNRPMSPLPCQQQLSSSWVVG